MHHASDDDYHGKAGMSDPPDPGRNVEPTPQGGEKCGGERGPHGHYAPDGERCRRVEQQRIDHIGGARQPQAEHVGNDHGHEHQTGPAMHKPSRPHGQTGQVAARQQGLDQQQPQRQHPCEAGGDVDRVAPGEQRTGCRDGNGQRDGEPKTSPDQPCAERRHHAQAGCSTKWALRLVSRALGMTGRRKTVRKPWPP